MWGPHEAWDFERAVDWSTVHWKHCHHCHLSAGLPWGPSNLLLCSLCPCPLFSVAQTVKCLPAMQETPVQSLGWEDLLEKKMAAHSNILAWKIPWTEELQSMGLQRVGHY